MEVAESTPLWSIRQIQTEPPELHRWPTFSIKPASDENENDVKIPCGKSFLYRIDQIGVKFANAMIHIANFLRFNKCCCCSCDLTEKNGQNLVNSKTRYALRFTGTFMVLALVGAVISGIIVTTTHSSDNPILKCEKQLEKLIWPNNRHEPEIYNQIGSEETKWQKLNQKVIESYHREWAEFLNFHGDRCQLLDEMSKDTTQDYCSKRSSDFLSFSDCLNKIETKDLNPTNDLIQKIITDECDGFC